MLKLNICENIFKIFKKLNEKEIFIFGTGNGGRIALTILDDLGIEKIKFLDNDPILWNRVIDGKAVCNPELLLSLDKDKIVILVGSQYYAQISEQLKLYGLEENINFYDLITEKSVRNSTQDIDNKEIINNLIKLGEDKSDLDIQIFGDSIMSYTSKNDLNQTTLFETINRKLRPYYTTNGNHCEGFHVGIFYAILNMLIYLKKTPKVAVLPINMHSFSPSWDIKPIHEYSELFSDINTYLKNNNYFLDKAFDLDKKTTYEEYLKHSKIYAGDIEVRNDWFVSWLNYSPTNNEEKHKRYKNIYTWYLNFKLEKTHRKVLVLEELIKLCLKNNIKIISYITPINYKQCEYYLGESFSKTFLSNLKIITEILEKYKLEGLEYFDFSFLFEETRFVHSHDIEHLNEMGRNELAENILEIIKKQL